jgi:dTDP-4-amino-4,6-dideoxygalactose transaminase
LIRRADLRIIQERIEPFFIKIRRQRENALYLLKNLKIKGVRFPLEKRDCLSNYYQFAIKFRNQTERDKMAEHLWNRGIDTAKYLDDIVDAASTGAGYQGDCSHAEEASKTALIVPHYYSLRNKDLEFIMKSLNEFESHD